MQTSIVGKAADATLGAVLRLTGLTAALGTGYCLMELGWRLVEKAASNLNVKPEAGDKDGDTAKSWSNTFSELINIRSLLKDESTSNILRYAGRCFVIAMIVREIADSLFGPPIQGYNLIGKFIGLQILSNGTYSNLPRWIDWRRFFDPM